MLRAVFSFLAALLHAIPVLLRDLSGLIAASDAEKHKQAKNARNAAAIAEAQKALDKE
jgi:hypothetical protein